MKVLEYFDLYDRAGLQPIPLYPKSKRPMRVGWNKNWDREQSRLLFEQQQDLNIGLLLGTIVDVESDTEDGNLLLERLIGDIQHPRFRSSRSIHHIFSSPDSTLTATRFQGVEFRGRLHQSVVPPSVHEDGVSYVWLRGTAFPPPTMPQALHEFYLRHRPEPKSVKPRVFCPRVRPGHIETICHLCSKPQFIHKKRLRLEVHAFAEIGQRWQCHHCRKTDVREACRRLRKFLS